MSDRIVVEKLPGWCPIEIPAVDPEATKQPCAKCGLRPGSASFCDVGGRCICRECFWRWDWSEGHVPDGWVVDGLGI